MNKAEFLFEIYKYLKVWSFDVWVWFVLQVGIAKTRARILLKLLSGVFNLKETHITSFLSLGIAMVLKFLLQMIGDGRPRS